MSDFLVKDGGVVSTRLRATNQPEEIENGVCFDLKSRLVTDVAVYRGGVGTMRRPCADDAKWQAEGDRALPEDLRCTIRTLRVVDWLDYFNGKEFGTPTDPA